MSIQDLLQQNTITSEVVDFVEAYCKGDNIEMYQLAGDASNRQYFRVVHGENSYVLMFWEPYDPNNYPFISVQNLLDESGVRVPQILSTDSKKGLLLLEDLGDLTLERKYWGNQNHQSSLPFYKQALDELIKIHYISTVKNDSNCSAFQLAFNQEKLLWEMNYGFKHVFEGLLKLNLTDRDTSAIKNSFADICQKLDVEKKYICHRDFHSRNVMIKLGKVVLIDFQDARLGPIQYDLVSLLHDSYVDIDPDFESQLLDYYLNQAKNYNASLESLDEFSRLYKLQKVQRCFKACGSFASFFNTREDKRYLKYLGHTLKKVSDTLNEINEYSEFTKIISNEEVLDYDYLNPIKSED